MLPGVQGSRQIHHQADHGRLPGAQLCAARAARGQMRQGRIHAY